MVNTQIPQMPIRGMLIHEYAIVVDEFGQLPPLTQALETDLWISRHDDIDYYARSITPDAVPQGYALTPVRQLLRQWASHEFERASRALQLLEWQRNHLFCSRCGTRTFTHSHEHATICPTCHYTQYPRLQPCVIVVITRQDRGQPEILLARSSRSNTGMFSLIAGFVEVGETLEQAVAREVAEEVGLVIKDIRYLGSQPWPFPSNLMIGFQAEYVSGEFVLQEDEIAEAHFYPIDQLPLTPPQGSIAHRLIKDVIAQYQSHPTATPA